MNTEVIVTGTGVPVPNAKRAGAGVLVRRGRTRLQFDAGRATSMRLSELGVGARSLTAVFITHHHSDHVVGLQDLALTAWELSGRVDQALTIVAPEGPSARFARRVFEVWDDDIQIRMQHTGREQGPTRRVIAFEAKWEPSPVWEKEDVKVTSVLVHHEPVEPAVAYRVDTPEGGRDQRRHQGL